MSTATNPWLDTTIENLLQAGTRLIKVTLLAGSEAKQLKVFCRYELFDNAIEYVLPRLTLKRVEAL